MALAGGRPLDLAWANEVGGLTYALGAGAQREFVKWTPVESGIDLSRAVDRLAWAAAFRPVPRVLARGADAVGSWIVTAALPGENAISERWRGAPGRAVRAIGAGLREFHDALPDGDCPFSWSARERLADARRRAAAGGLLLAGLHPEHQRLSVDAALASLATPPPIDRAVVCHGDACAPSTLLNAGGRCAGHVDLGELGVGDRWAYLAVASWSAEWNYGPGWEGELLDAYGVAPVPGRTAYYRLLWDLGP